MNISFYSHLPFWVNAGHNMSTVTTTNKHYCRPSDLNYFNDSSCIKQFESLARYSTVLSQIFLSEHFGLNTIAKSTNSCLIMKLANTFLFKYSLPSPVQSPGLTYLLE